MKAIISLALLFFLSACGSLRGSVEEYGSLAFDELEQSSVTAAKGAKRYLCETIRDAAKREVFPTVDEQTGLDMICLRAPK